MDEWLFIESPALSGLETNESEIIGLAKPLVMILEFSRITISKVTSDV